MRKSSHFILLGSVVAGLLGIGCRESSPFAANDPSQATRGIAAGPAGESELSSAAIATRTPAAVACSRTMAIDHAALDELTAGWAVKPKEAVKEFLTKYGAPLEASTESVVWHEAGPYKRIMVTKNEVPHDFPKPHTDFIEHTIVFDVPAAKVDDLIRFDTSMTINRTAAELAARGDSEAQNARTLDLARAIVAGKKTVDEARKALGAKHPQ